MAEESSKNRKAEFYRIYNEKIRPKLQDFEKNRIALLKKKTTNLILFTYFPAVIFIFIIILAIVTKGKSITAASLPFIMIIPMIMFLSTFGYAAEEEKKFKSSLKLRRLPTLLKAFGDIQCNQINQQNYIKSDILDDNEIKRSGLFGSYASRTIDDEFQGNYRDIPFKASETILLIDDKYIFKGIILSFKYNKKIKNRTIIETKHNFSDLIQLALYIGAAIFLIYLIFCMIQEERNNIFPIISLIYFAIYCIIIPILYIFYKKSLSNKVVSLEDPKFSKRFNIYSYDQVEARYLITTAFMERFYNLKTAFGAKNIKCSFFDDTLMIAIETKKDLFEIGSLYKSLNSPETINSLYKELNSIYEIIDYLKLYENIGL